MALISRCGMLSTIANCQSRFRASAMRAMESPKQEHPKSGWLLRAFFLIVDWRSALWN